MVQSARLGLPLLIPGQGQKDMTHNEALQSLDVLVQAVVVSRSVVSPPETVSEGECWLVPEGATGAWTGKEHCIAGWTLGGWRFLPAAEGWYFWVTDESIGVRRSGAGWKKAKDIPEAGDPVASPSGGTVQDVEARATIASIIDRLAMLGLIGT